MSILTDILDGKVNAYTVHETAQFIAVMEPTPNTIGHIICFPKEEAHDLFALEQKTYQALMAFVQTVAKALKEVVPCRKIGMASIGLAVEHVHIHLVPINTAVDMNFMASHAEVEDKIKQQLAKKINAQINAMHMQALS